jgi:hypothetical protein
MECLSVAFHCVLGISPSSLRDDDDGRFNVCKGGEQR